MKENVVLCLLLCLFFVVGITASVYAVFGPCEVYLEGEFHNMIYCDKGECYGDVIINVQQSVCQDTNPESNCTDMPCDLALVYHPPKKVGINIPYTCIGMDCKQDPSTRVAYPGGMNCL